MDNEMNMPKEGQVENVGADTTEELSGGQEPEKKYSDADVDRIVARKIAAERKKMSKLLNEEQQETEIEKRERDVLKRELRMEAFDKLLERDLPKSLIDILNYNSREECAKSIEVIDTAFKSALRDVFLKEVCIGTPKTGTGSNDDIIRSAFAAKARN